MVVNSTDSEMSETKPKTHKRLSRLSAWLVLMSLGLLFVPLYLINITIEESTALLAEDLSRVQEALAVVPEPNAEETTLRDMLEQLQVEKQILESIRSDLEANYIDWPSLIAALGNLDPTRIEINGLTQENQRITIMGTAHDELSITHYADMLRETQLFEQVTVQLITLETTPATEDTPAFTVATFTIGATTKVGLL